MIERTMTNEKKKKVKNRIKIMNKMSINLNEPWHDEDNFVDREKNTVLFFLNSLQNEIYLKALKMHDILLHFIVIDLTHEKP